MRLIYLLLFLACRPSGAEPIEATTTLDEAVAPVLPSHDTVPQGLRYAWLESATEGVSTVATTVAPPVGFVRMPLAKGSFEEWLRYLPLASEGTPVRYYNGAVKPDQGGAYRVLDIDVGKRDLQQCADAVMRLRAEYLYSKSRYADVHFNHTSGHTVGFEDWSFGRKPSVSGNSVTISPRNTSEPDTSYRNFRAYLTQIFNYAGTASLTKELMAADISNAQAGDVFIQGGFPGHAVIVVDVAKSTDGRQAILLAQSYMPAQSIHILTNPTDPDSSPWYIVDETLETLYTPDWTFRVEDLRRF